MAETSTPLPPPPPLDPNPSNPQPDNPTPQPESTPTISTPTPTTTTTTQPQLTPPPPPPQPQQQSTSLNPNPNSPQIVPHPNPNQFAHPPPPPPLGSSPSFRPAGAPIPPNFTPIPPNPNFPQASYPTPPPGVGAPQQIYPGSNLGLRPPFVTLPNGGFLGPTLPQGSVLPPGVVRYPFPPIARPPFITRPPVAVGTVPPQPRPPFLGVRPTPQIIRPPVLPIIIPAEKPQTTVYVGKIAPSVENDFIRSLLELCGPIKSWKRAQDPSDGTPKRFGFCEFESAEGVLRALRLLTKCSVDGEELVLNVNQATRDYLERYVKKKKENLNKPSEIGADEAKKEGQNLAEVQNGEGDKQNEASKPSVVEPKKDENETENKGSDMSVFGLVTDEDRDADREAQEKITNMIEERVKNKPLPPPPPPPAAPAQKVVDSANDSNMEAPAKSGDKESDVDVKNEEKNDDETSDIKPASRAGTDSPDRGRRYESRGRDRDRERDRRDKERELDRLERERERERARRERERELEIQRAERFYKERVKEWEGREKDKEYKRKQERDKEKDKERERRKLIAEQEDESDDDTRKRRRKSDIEDKRRRRRREKEDDLADRLKEEEEEEIAEAKKRAEEEEQQRQQEIAASVEMANGVESSVPEEESIVTKHDVELVQDSELAPENHTGDGILENGNNDDTAMTSGPTTVKPGGNAPAKKLGFGLVGSGKRAAVPSVFHEEEDDDAHKEKKLRPLVPIDYSTEENHISHTTDTTVPLNSSASADTERERGRRSHDRSGHRERDRDGNDGRARDGNAILDAKQLIDMIPKTKDDLFSYEINWTVYDENRLHERMRPWISKKITEFLGEEETTLVEFIVDKFREHVKAETMLDILQQVLDEEAEMFVLKMWRMLIFEIKRVETGLAPRPGT